jgi:hypothetical protein
LSQHTPEQDGILRLIKILFVSGMTFTTTKCIVDVPWSWWVVTAPLWILPAILSALITTLFLLAVFLWIFWKFLRWLGRVKPEPPIKVVS